MDIAAEPEEERNYQAALAESLGVPYITPSQPNPAPNAPTTASSSRTIKPAAPAQWPTPAVPRQTGPVQTVPYVNPVITRHMNADWMRPHTDNTKQRKQVTHKPGNKFVIVLWKDVHILHSLYLQLLINSQVAVLPTVYAVDNCPQWPTWCLIDSCMVQEELGISSEHLEFYDVCYAQWVSCSPSYPHDVKKDGRLLLRRPGVICEDFDLHLQHATDKPVHMRFNMPGERSAIKEQLRQRAKPSHISVFSPSDNDSEVEFVDLDPVTPTRSSFKRSRDVSTEGDRTRPTKHICEILTPISIASSPSPAPSPLYSISSLPDLPSGQAYNSKEIVVPKSTKLWPSGMYAVDMARAFLKINLPFMKKTHSTLASRLTAVFKTDVHSNTYHDQLRLWKRAPEHVRQVYLGKG